MAQPNLYQKGTIGYNTRTANKASDWLVANLDTLIFLYKVVTISIKYSRPLLVIAGYGVLSIPEGRYDLKFSSEGVSQVIPQ